MRRILSWLTIAIFTVIIVSCSDDEKKTPDNPSLDLAKNITGNWLLSTSDADNWVAYEITETSRINAEIAQNGYYGNGTGYYSIEGKDFSGSYTTDRGQTFYIDWKVSDIKTFEIGVQITDDNELVGDASLYRIVGNSEIEIGTSWKPDFRGLCGTSNVSDFKVLNSDIAEVDSMTGEITAKKDGITFITFLTPNGTAAIKITGVATAKSFKELLIGTWVYDVPAEKDWERFTFSDNGYVLVEWATLDGVYNLEESGNGLYTIDGQTVTFSVNSSIGQMNMRMVTESINDMQWTYSMFNGSSMNGKYTVQRLLESITLSPEGTQLPDYQSLVGTTEIQSYRSHNEAVATVSPIGEITAKKKGRTYIDVITSRGTGVIEVNVDGGVIPVAFEDCLGKGKAKVFELLGYNPYYEDETTLIYHNFTSDIDMIGVRLDDFSGLVKGVTVTFNSSVDKSQVTSILNTTFVPFMSQTTETFKAYMNTAERAEASVGVTWDIPELTLTYVNLMTDLFPDYSILIGMTRSEVLNKMVIEPILSDEKSQSWFFYDNKGVSMVSAYYTDFTTIFDNVQSVVTVLDETLSEEEITKYLKKKYPYYPEYSTSEELVFVPEGHAMEIYYELKDRMIMYISTSKSSPASKAKARSTAKKIKLKSKSINR